MVIFKQSFVFQGNFLGVSFLHDVRSLLFLLDFLSLEEECLLRMTDTVQKCAQRDFLMFCLTFLDILKLLGV